MDTAYDEVRYPSSPIYQTHPARLAAAQALLGLPFAPLDTGRVLEIGCGEAANIIPIAVDYPGAQVVGFDLAASAIAEGQRLADRLGLSNLRLEARDILAGGEDLGVFDYIIAHGVYSWVPESVRDGLLAMIGQCLAPGGVAFISYNALPGCHLRLILREMLMRHLRGRTGFAARVEAAHEFLRFYIDQGQDDDPTAATIKTYCRDMLARDPHVLFHDELGDIYQPFYFEEFLADADRHGLAFLAESEGLWWREELFPSVRGKAIARIASDDVIDIHQYVDFLSARRFRQTLLRHKSQTVDRRPDFARLRGLFVRGEARPETGADLMSDAPVRFDMIKGAGITLTDPILKQALARIGQAFPGAVAACDLPAHPDLDEGLLQLFCSGALDLLAEPPKLVAVAGEYPLAGRLARAQIAAGLGSATSLAHTAIDFADPMVEAFIGVLDGARTRQEIAAWMADRGGAPHATVEQVDQHLQTLAKLGFIAA